MIVLNYGLPRSGTLWTNAIIRAILDHHGIAYRNAAPNARSLLPTVSQFVGQGLHRWQVLVLLTHDWSPELAAALAGAEAHRLAFANLRDPRDVCAALMESEGAPLPETVAATRRYAAKYGPCLRQTGAVGLRYEAAVDDSAALVAAVAAGMGLRLDTVDARRIAARTAPDETAADMWLALPPDACAAVDEALGPVAEGLGYDR